MADAIQYASIAPYEPLPAEAVCAGCGRGKMLVRDHCHEHGWMRDIVCGSCNMYLGIIDKRRATPGVGEQYLAALLAIRNRCPDCDQLEVADLKPRSERSLRVPRTEPVKYSEVPASRECRLRKKAGRQGYKLTVRRRTGIYSLVRAKGKPMAFASMDAVEEFLTGAPSFRR